MCLRRKWFAVLVLFAVGALVAPASVGAAGLKAHAAATCSDYSNQADAQRGKDTRDGDGDGIYCEDLPCPCLKPGSGGGGGKPKPRKHAKVYKARIISVTDGDTIKVRLASGSKRTVRLIGIDTPESHKPGVPVECGAREATASM